MKIQDYVKRRTKKCIICFMLIVALFLPAIRNNIISVFADELETEGEETPFNPDTEKVGEKVEEHIYLDSSGEEAAYPTAQEDKQDYLLDYVEVDYNEITSSTIYYITDAEGKPILTEDGMELAVGSDSRAEVLEETFYVIEKEEPAVPAVAPEAGDNGEGESAVPVATPEVGDSEGELNTPALADNNSTDSKEIEVAGSKYEVLDPEKVGEIQYGRMEDGVFRALPDWMLGKDADGNVTYPDEYHAYIFMEDGSYKETSEVTKMVVGDKEIYVNEDAEKVITDLQKLANGTFLNEPAVTPTDETETQTDETNYDKWSGKLAEIRTKAKESGLDVKVTCSVKVVENGEETVKIFDPTMAPDVSMNDQGELCFTVQKSEEGDYFYISVPKTDENGNVVLENGNVVLEEFYVESDQVIAETVYKVVDGKYDEGKKVLCEIDATTMAEIKKGNFVRVNNMYKVKDKDNNYVYFTADEWKVVKGKHTVYEETTKYYYTAEPQYNVKADDDNEVQKEIEVSLEGEENSRKLKVEFWENAKIKRTGKISWEQVASDKIKITVPYKYLSHIENGEPVWIDGIYEETKDIEWLFGNSTEATLKIKYTPKIINTETTEISEDDKVTILPDGTIKVVENGGDPINPDKKDAILEMGTIKRDGENDGINQGSQEPRLAHVDVKTQGLVNKQIAGQNVSACVSDVSVSINGTPVEMFTSVSTDNNRGDGEYITCKRGQTNVNHENLPADGSKAPENHPYHGCERTPLFSKSEIDAANGEVLITINATISYTLTENGKPVTKSFLYTVNLYPERSYAWDSAKGHEVMDGEPGINECRWWDNDGGFDYTIKANVIEELIRRNIKTSYQSEVETSVEHGSTLVPTPTPPAPEEPEPTPPTPEEPEPTPPTPEETPEPTPETPDPTPEPTPETPDPTPETTPDPTPETTPGTTPAPEVTPTPGTPEETPEPEPTPETPDSTPAVTPTVPTTPNEPPTTPTVLGARRVQMGVSEASVLGARRGLETAVLGKRRRPSTGDSIALFIWIIVLSVAMGGAISSVIVLESERDKRNRKMS